MTTRTGFGWMICLPSGHGPVPKVKFGDDWTRALQRGKFADDWISLDRLDPAGPRANLNDKWIWMDDDSDIMIGLNLDA